MSKPKVRREQEAARLAAEARKAAARRHTRRTRIAIGTVGAAAALAGLVTLGALTGKSQSAAHDPHAAHAAAAAVGAARAGAGQPPWPNAADPARAIRAAGLTAAGAEGRAEHYHAHLDVIVDGTPVTVPGSIGVDEGAQQISPLHTHDASGAIHVEAPTVGTPYYLGQLFAEWDVALSEHMIGGLHADGSATTLTAYVNGRRVAGDPARIRLAEHQEIALVYGPAGQRVDVPDSYDFGEL